MIETCAHWLLTSLKAGCTVSRPVCVVAAQSHRLLALAIRTQYLGFHFPTSYSTPDLGFTHVVLAAVVYYVMSHAVVTHWGLSASLPDHRRLHTSQTPGCHLAGSANISYV